MSVAFVPVVLIRSMPSLIRSHERSRTKRVACRCCLKDLAEAVASSRPRPLAQAEHRQNLSLTMQQQRETYLRLTESVSLYFIIGSSDLAGTIA